MKEIHRQIATYRAAHQRLERPAGGHHSSEDEIVTGPAMRRLLVEREQRAEEEKRRDIEAERLRIAELTWRKSRRLAKLEFRDRVRMIDVMRAVSRHYDVSITDIRSSRRDATTVRPRQIYFYLARTLTGASYPDMGRFCGDRDHTTCLHGFRKIKSLMETDSAIASDIEAIRAKLRDR